MTRGCLDENFPPVSHRLCLGDRLPRSCLGLSASASLGLIIFASVFWLCLEIPAPVSPRAGLSERGALGQRRDRRSTSLPSPPHPLSLPSPSLCLIPLFLHHPRSFLLSSSLSPSFLPSPSRGPTPLVQLGGLGERCKFPSGSGQSPAAKRFVVHFS